jgi:hypothetical protein
MSAKAHNRLPDGYITTWWSTEPLGNFKSLTAVTAGPAAIVAAFSIAGVVAVLARDHVEFLDAAAAVLFAAAAFVLFDLLLAAVDASAVSVTPEERLDWFPEGKKDKTILTPLRHRQLHDFAAFIYYSDRIKVLYRVGLFLALTGLASLMLARVDGTRFDLTSRGAGTECLLVVGALLLLGVATLHLARGGLLYTRTEARQVAYAEQSLSISLAAVKDPTCADPYGDD